MAIFIYPNPPKRFLTPFPHWHDPPPRAPPEKLRFPQQPSPPDPDWARTVEVDPDFLEHLRRERAEQAELPMDF